MVRLRQPYLGLVLLVPAVALGVAPAADAATPVLDVFLVASVPAWGGLPERCVVEADVCTPPEDPPQESATIEPAAGAVPPGYLRAEVLSFTWNDANGDGLVQPAERQGRADILAGKSAIVTPSGAWPPGSLRARDYTSLWSQRVSPLTGTEPVELRLNSLTTYAGNWRTGSIDAVFVPTGSALGLSVALT